MSKIDVVEKKYLKENVPVFKVGDEVKVHLKVREGDKTRIQIFAGTVIRKKGHGTSASFTVLKETRGDVVEKVFPLHSPQVDQVTVTTKGKVRRAKLYYLRDQLSKKS
ncbi:MAG: 50S ribosomal protein L19 [Omnitrophica bacterium RIFCSPHIGHO2_02_FULL_49_9]|nr:MAG: 50S ribosomal protein L19 [Omnitrophica bacterium RIFCSPHIGHO2_02_FULL_49_9]OGW88833.1 MAG: 50S ribosomal protein L19 [Omnitrophica bacterium RIFCSPLOWO2_01_FULL_50_24]